MGHVFCSCYSGNWGRRIRVRGQPEHNSRRPCLSFSAKRIQQNVNRSTWLITNFLLKRKKSALISRLVFKLSILKPLNQMRYQIPSFVHARKVASFPSDEPLGSQREAPSTLEWVSGIGLCLLHQAERREHEWRSSWVCLLPLISSQNYEATSAVTELQELSSWPLVFLHFYHLSIQLKNEVTINNSIELWSRFWAF